MNQEYIIDKAKVKFWVIKNSRITNPYKKNKVFASVTLGNDINGEGNTIEGAYMALTERIIASKYLSDILIESSSYINLYLYA